MLVVDVDTRQHDHESSQNKEGIWNDPFFTQVIIAKTVIQEQTQDPHQNGSTILPHVPCHTSGDSRGHDIENTRHGENDH